MKWDAVLDLLRRDIFKTLAKQNTFLSVCNGGLRLKVRRDRLREAVRKIWLGEKEVLFFAFEIGSEKLGAVAAREDDFQIGLIQDKSVRELSTRNRLRHHDISE